MSFQTPDFGPQNRKVLVTPSFFPTGGNFRGYEPAKSIAELFPLPAVAKHGATNKTGIHAHTFGHIDWLTIRQSHAGQPLPALKSRQTEVGVKSTSGTLRWNATWFNVVRPLWGDSGSCDLPGTCTRVEDGSVRNQGIELAFYLAERLREDIRRRGYSPMQDFEPQEM